MKGPILFFFLSLCVLTSCNSAVDFKLPEPQELFLQNPADATNPLEFPNEIKIRNNKAVKLEASFYNKRNITITNAEIGISRCAEVNSGSPKLNYLDELPEVVSTIAAVPMNRTQKFAIVIKPAASIEPDIYICTAVVYNAHDDLRGQHAEIYEEKDFFLLVLA